VHIHARMPYPYMHSCIYACIYRCIERDKERCRERRRARHVIGCVDIVDHALVEQQADYVGESPLDSCDEDGLASLHREG
jgi:hypothetical protein